jgi:hypothetical protein
MTSNYYDEPNSPFEQVITFINKNRNPDLIYSTVGNIVVRIRGNKGAGRTTFAKELIKNLSHLKPVVVCPASWRNIYEEVADVADITSFPYRVVGAGYKLLILDVPYEEIPEDAYFCDVIVQISNIDERFF